MSWTPTIYAQFPDEATARAAATSLGADFPSDGSALSGDNNYALAAPITEWMTRPVYGGTQGAIMVVSPGQLQSGYWAMLRFNLGTSAGAAAYAQFQTIASTTIRTLANPCNVFAGGS
jgi:hypothetical protein